MRQTEGEEETDKQTDRGGREQTKIAGEEEGKKKRQKAKREDR